MLFISIWKESRVLDLHSSHLALRYSSWFHEYNMARVCPNGSHMKWVDTTTVSDLKLKIHRSVSMKWTIVVPRPCRNTLNCILIPTRSPIRFSFSFWKDVKLWARSMGKRVNAANLRILIIPSGSFVCFQIPLFVWFGIRAMFVLALAKWGEMTWDVIKKMDTALFWWKWWSLLYESTALTKWLHQSLQCKNTVVQIGALF